MTPAQFIATWHNTSRSERSAAQEHFLDLCALFGHPRPGEVDGQGMDFTFERLIVEQKPGGKTARGFADVFKRNYFAWEYKRPDRDLDAAYDQLRRYRDELDNPPLLVTSDLKSFHIHTNFTNTPRKTHRISIASLDQPVVYETLRSVFFAPEKLRPQTTIEKITGEVAGKLAEIAITAIARNQEHARKHGLPLEEVATRVAHYLDRIVFCLFAEDIGLLEDKVFTQIVERYGHKPADFAAQVGQLFQTMDAGGFFGVSRIPRFNGALFGDEPVIELSLREIEAVREAALLDWKDVDPTIFGTLFERGLDPAKRSQLGAHYTGRGDIETLIEPVVLRPLRLEWEAHKEQLKNCDKLKQSQLIEAWLQELGRIKVLDASCGSGNFLALTLARLLDLEKLCLNWAALAGVKDAKGRAFKTRIRPESMLGIEVNPYAYDLARTVLQIAYLQWLHANGYERPDEPILHDTNKIECRDALFDQQTGVEASWPDADFIVGNPPFLGDKKLRRQLEDDYVEQLFKCFRGQVPSSSDLCCYWFHKATKQLKIPRTRPVRVGLVATQSICGGKNRETLDKIPNIFFAVSDRDWTLDGANVRISLIGFDGGYEQERVLDNAEVGHIYSNLTATVDVSKAQKLPANRGVGFIGTTKKAPLDVPDSLALAWLDSPNPHGRPNSDVLVPYLNGNDVTTRNSKTWIVDFGTEMDESAASLYERPFGHIEKHVLPLRENHREAVQAKYWWRLARPVPELIKRISSLKRVLATPIVAKHRLFVWLQYPFNPDHQLTVFARDDDYFFGVVQSRLHEIWALACGTNLGVTPRYTPTSCFETFPFPRADVEHKEAISQAAAQLNQRREDWLAPPDWMEEEVLEFRASADGPWREHLVEGSVDAKGVGLARYVRRVLKEPRKTYADERYDSKIKARREYVGTIQEAFAHRTLTNLYNHRPKWLKDAHEALDKAVFAAYGWPDDLTDDQILARLLDLNDKYAEAA